MRLRRLAFRGLTRFNGEPVRIDLDAMGPGLVALVGANGEGKTTVLEGVPAVLYKRFPTRPGSLYDYTHGRDAFIEAEFSDGGSPPDFLKVRVQVDSDRKLTEGYVFVNGEPVTTGRAKEFEAEVERRFGSAELFLASAFAAQNKAGSFLGMARTERKELFAQLLGLGHLQVLAVRARDRRSSAETSLAVERRAVATAEAEVQDGAALEGQLQEARTKAEEAAGALQTAREEEAAAISAVERAKAAAALLESLDAAVGGAKREYDAADRAFRDAEALPGKAEAEAERARKILSGRDPAAMETRACDRHTDAVASLELRLADLRLTMAEEPAVTEATQEALDLLAESGFIDERLQEIEALKARKDRAGDALHAQERRLEDATNAAIKEAERLRRQASLMEKAPCTSSSSWTPYESVLDAPHLRERVTRDLAGTCPLLKDAREAKLAIASATVDPAVVEEMTQASDAFEALLVEVSSVEPEEERAEARRKEITERLPAVQRLSARAGVVTAARKQLNDAGAERKRIDDALADELEQVEKAKVEIAAESTRIAQDLEQTLKDAVARIHEAKKRLDEARRLHLAAIVKANAEREKRPPTVMAAQMRADSCQVTRAGAERTLREADDRQGQLTAALDRLKTVKEVLDRSREEVARAEEQLGDWTLLERCLGKDGAQALEIDAAGPEVSKLTNELLTACYGPRFSITLETLREKKSSPGEFAEAFDVKVYDGGQERPVEALSGGERVVVGEALGLAIAIFNARKSGIQWRTLFRDETAGALDPRNAQAYVEMLRRALELGGFDQVLFVSHSPEVWQRADARLLVQGGRVVPETTA